MFVQCFCNGQDCDLSVLLLFRIKNNFTWTTSPNKNVTKIFEELNYIVNRKCCLINFSHWFKEKKTIEINSIAQKIRGITMIYKPVKYRCSRVAEALHPEKMSVILTYIAWNQLSCLNDVYVIRESMGKARYTS